MQSSARSQEKEEEAKAKAKVESEGTFCLEPPLMVDANYFKMAYKDFTQFQVWQKAFDLLMIIYEASRKIPKEEKYGLVSDIRRASNSVVHNIAEGFGRYEPRDKTRFYKISRGSAYETISQTLVCGSLNYFQERDKQKLISGYRDVINEIDKIIKTVESR